MRLYFLAEPACGTFAAEMSLLSVLHFFLFTQSLRDLRGSGDTLGARTSFAEQRAADLADQLQRLTDRVNKTEPRVDDALKDLAYSVEGVCVCVPSFVPEPTSHYFCDIQIAHRCRHGGTNQVDASGSDNVEA